MLQHLQRFPKICPSYLQMYISRYENPRAAIIVIGNEILKAQVKDTNSYFMCKLLYKCGLEVRKISVISDNVEEIAKEIQNFSKKYTYVITSGGIGPTHDDVTYEGLAKAFNEPLHYHPDLVDIIKNKFGYKDRSSTAYKMAHVPSNACLIFGMNKDTGDPLPYPCINLQNVYVFPGSPSYLEKSFLSLYKKLFSTSKNFVKEEVYINASETTFADILTNVSKEYPNVSFGSYPTIGHSHYKTLVTIDSYNKEATKRAKERFCSLLPESILVEYDNSPHINSTTKYIEFLKKCGKQKTYECTFEKLRMIYNGPDEVAIYFDGSRESIILIHMAYIVTCQKKLQLVYFKNKGLTPNILPFVQDIVKRYNASVHELEDDTYEAMKHLTSLKPNLRILLTDVRNPGNTFFQLAAECKMVDLKIEIPLIHWSEDEVRSFSKSLSLPAYMSKTT